MLLSPGCHPYFFVWMDEASHRQYAQAALRGQLSMARQRSAVEWHQEVDGNRVCLDLLQCEDHLDQLLIAFAHPGDQA